MEIPQSPFSTINITQNYTNTD